MAAKIKFSIKHFKPFLFMLFSNLIIMYFRSVSNDEGYTILSLLEKYNLNSPVVENLMPSIIEPVALLGVVVISFIAGYLCYDNFYGGVRFFAALQIGSLVADASFDAYALIRSVLYATETQADAKFDIIGPAISTVISIAVIYIFHAIENKSPSYSSSPWIPAKLITSVVFISFLMSFLLLLASLPDNKSFYRLFGSAINADSPTLFNLLYQTPWLKCLLSLLGNILTVAIPLIEVCRIRHRVRRSQLSDILNYFSATILGYLLAGVFMSIAVIVPQAIESVSSADLLVYRFSADLCTVILTPLFAFATFKSINRLDRKSKR